MGDYTTSISFVCHMPPVFQTNVCQDTSMEKKCKKWWMLPWALIYIVYKEIINSTFFRN